MSKAFESFVKATGYLPVKCLFRTAVYYEDKSVQGRYIKGPAIIISNHTSLYDYAAFMFVFFNRTLRYQMAELLFDKKPLGWILKGLGGIFVDRNSYDFSFVNQTCEILNNGGVVGIFPEGRLPHEGEKRPLPFKPSAAYIALESGAPVIPVATNGSYFKMKRARVIIGKPLYARELVKKELSDKENLENISRIMRKRIIELGNELKKKTDKTVRI